MLVYIDVSGPDICVLDVSAEKAKGYLSHLTK